jgi:D-alanyl-lipoteichoic acid acyltransferase DltB (MBOAT superfamily)
MIAIAYRLLMWSQLFILLMAYPLVAWLVVTYWPARRKVAVFALVNVLFSFLLLMAALVGDNHDIAAIAKVGEIAGLAFSGYLCFAIVQFLLLRSASTEPAWIATLFFPILILAVVKYIPAVRSAFSAELQPLGVGEFSALFLGISYMSFRLCLLSQQVRNDVVQMPSLSEFLAYAFFVPTLAVGPISPYRKFIQSWRNPDRLETPLGRSMLRVLVGLTKYFFFATILNQYTYDGLLFDGHPHRMIDLVLAVFSYTFYLYCNFSGFCDMAIGVSGLLGIAVMENFDRPFLARNMQQFWNRWHISLSTLARDMMFTPLVKWLVRIFGPGSTNHAIAFSIFVVFIVIGIWHGFGVNYVFFGISQGSALAVVHYYTLFIKRVLGRAGYLRYQQSKIIEWVARTCTFTYFSSSLFFLANSWDHMKKIASVIV